MNEINYDQIKLAYKNQSALVKNAVRRKIWTFFQEKLHVESRQNTRERFNIYNELTEKTQKPEQDIFNQSHVENFNDLFASIGKNFFLKLNPSTKLK